jgi:hypothetical protein
MQLNWQAFLDGWETTQPLLQQDRLLHDLSAKWGKSLPQIWASLEPALASVTTDEGLFERLYHEPTVALIPYAAILVLRTLIDPSAQPETAITGDLTIVPQTAMVIYGNATISGTVKNNGALIVLGDLTIEHLYGDAVWAYTLLAVGGSVRTRGVVTYGDILIGGDLKLSEVTQGWYNDYSLNVGGIVQTKALLEEHHATRYMTLDAQATVDLYGDSAHLREFFVDELLSETEENGEIEVELDVDELFDRLQQGQSVYRS